MSDHSPRNPAPAHEALRYHRQTLLREVGAEGQRLLGASHALIVGCGALGSVSAEMLARAGVGRLTLIDRDIVEWSNLQRQTLYDESDARAGLPKAEAAARRLARINSSIRIDALARDFSPATAERLAPTDADVILDATDNFATRYLLNDLAVKRRVPFLYAASVGTIGMAMPIIPQGASATNEPGGPCLRCLFEEPPAPGSPAAAATCDTLGVLGPVVAAVANIQAIEALKILLGRFDALNRSLFSLDFWSNDFHRLDISHARRDDCPCCALRRFDFLDSPSPAGLATSLCGRNTIQIAPHPTSPSTSPQPLDLAAVAARLAPHGSFTTTRFFLRGEFHSENDEHANPIRLTLFPDGRALFTGVTDESRARALYARYLGA